MGNLKAANQGLYTLSSDRLVYLVSPDNQFATFLSQQVTHFGYFVQHMRDLKSLANGIAEHAAIAVLVDIPSQAGRPEGEDIFEDLLHLQLGANSLIFISEDDDQSTRVKAIRAGGMAFFTKPLNIVSLIDKLDTLNPEVANPLLSRVLIVQDQYTVASYYQMVLKMAGMETQIAQNPATVLEHVREFHPDLILMDTFMSEINVLDLARVIRQMDEYVSIPIIFLSKEDDFGKRIEALDVGGDDFLIKPIKSSHLISVVRSRLERSRTLRSYMVRDSLTNLLNHTAFRSVLAREVSRSRRLNTQLALAMLDIDHFKTVNDTYGHSVGDSVLKGLSRLLQQRLRPCDIVGRYGGDELVALIIDCEVHQSLQIMDDIRLHFSEIDFFPVKAKPIHLTYSCGISAFPKFQTAETLSDSADHALYVAKADGRNRVVMA